MEKKKRGDERVAGFLRKRGQSGADTIFAIATLFGLALVCLIGVYTYDSFVSHAKNTTTFNQSTQAIGVLEDMQTTNLMWDYIILVVFIGFALAMMVLGYFVDAHTIFFPIFILVILIGLLVAGVLSHTWDKVADTSAFSTIKDTKFPITSHIFSNLNLYYVLIASLALLATYAKSRQEGIG